MRGRAITAAITIARVNPAPLDVLTLRAWARAYLWWAGEYELAEAVEALQEFAERDGLIEQIGQDGVQKILSDAFAPYREAAL
jgi:hypothetical protein